MIVDVHCHHYAFCKENGGHYNPRFAKGFRVRWYLRNLGLIEKKRAFFGDLPRNEVLDERYKITLVKRIKRSILDHSVVLAFDAVYDKDGAFDPERTPKMVTNDAVIALKKESDKILLGGSVNPARRDWKDELEKCIEAKASLIKWLPSVMGFDPCDPKFDPFYTRVIEADVPILVHIGYEYALPNIDIRYVGLDRLEHILKTGARVIAAHCCGGRPFVDDMKNFHEMRRLVDTYPKLYLDVSALASVHRKTRLLNSLRDSVVRERLVYGSDYPIPIHPWAFQRELKGVGKTLADLPPNYFTRDIELKRACGLDEKALSRGYEAIAKLQ